MAELWRELVPRQMDVTWVVWCEVLSGRWDVGWCLQGMALTSTFSTCLGLGKQIISRTALAEKKEKRAITVGQQQKKREA